MKKFASLFTLVMAVALIGPVHAQDKMSGGKMSGGKMTGGKMAPTKTAPAKTVSYTGPIKSVSGKTFTLGLKKGPLTVDASKATPRANGKFASLKVGDSATAVGTMSGTTLMATKVTITPAKTATKASTPKMTANPAKKK